MSPQSTINQETLEDLQQTLQRLRAGKPQDRGELARRYAVTITELEKTVAYFRTYVILEEPAGEEAQ